MRRALAAGLVGLAGWTAVTALAPPAPDPGSPVLVAARDIPAGSRLAPDGVRTEHLPPEMVPAGALTALAQLQDAVASGPVRSGEVLTDVRVTPAGLLHGLEDHLVLAHVPVADPAVVAALPPGVRVDVLSTVDGSVVAGDVLVVSAAVDPTVAAASGFFAAVTEQDAARLAVATAPELLGAGVTVVIRGASDPGRR